MKNFTFNYSTPKEFTFIPDETSKDWDDIGEIKGEGHTWTKSEIVLEYNDLAKQFNFITNTIQRFINNQKDVQNNALEELSDELHNELGTMKGR